MRRVLPLLLVAACSNASRTQLTPITPADSADSAPRAPTRTIAADASVARDGGGADAVAQAPQPPAQTAIPRDLNVLMISIDSLRADMPWAGYPHPIAPFLTELEARSVSFTHAYALSSYTSMSVGGFLGGRYPGELRRDGYFFGTYPRTDLMFPERLQAAGIRTVGAMAHGYFRAGKAGFDQGFDVWQLIPNLHWNPLADDEITGDRHVALAERLLSDPANTSGRFFAWFHFMDPHDVYRPHPGITPNGRTGRDRYDAEVTFADQQIRSFVTWVQQQPWGARTAIVITADHGEGFGEHGEFRHGFYLWQELVRVPWFFVIPGVSPRRIDVNRSHLDLAPTILELMGVAPEPTFTGHSLVPEITGQAQPEVRDVVVDLPRTSDNDRRRALIHDHYKLIASGDDSSFQVFDLDADPAERVNLQRTNRPVYDDMLTRYRALATTIRDVPPYQCRTLHGAPPGRGY